MKFQFTIAMLASMCIYYFGYSQSGTTTQVLSVGDRATSITAFRWIKGNPVERFEKGKVYVLEFGATWCVPCAAAIPKLTALADKYKDRVTVISMFVMERNDDPTNAAGYVTKVEKFVRKRWDNIRYHVAVDDPQKSMENVWLRAAGKNGVPYTFVVDKNGMIAWIGSSMTSLDSVIAEVVSKDYSLDAAMVRDKEIKSSMVPFDDTMLLLVDGNGGDDTDFTFRSLISPYDGKVKASNQSYVNSWRNGADTAYHYYRGRIQLVGVPLTTLYYMAFADTLSNRVYVRNWSWQYPDTIKNPHHKSSYGKYWHQPVLEVIDRSPFQWNRVTTANRFNYSLKVPDELGTARFLQEAMRRDLQTYFGYTVKVESRLMPYWKLLVTDRKKVLAFLLSKDQDGDLSVKDDEDPFVFKNALTRDIIWMLGSTYGFGPYDYGKLRPSEQAPFVDETGITEKIDFQFNRRWTFENVREYLRGIGLDLIKSHKPMKVVVIKDPEQVN